MPLFKLTMRQGPRPDQAFELQKDIYTIGREAGNDIIINDAQVSRHHARLTLQADTYLLEDLGSTNGTFVNGRRITGPVALSGGDMIGLGDTVVLAVSGGSDAAVTQVARPLGGRPTAPAMPAAPRTVAPSPTGGAAPAGQVGGLTPETRRMLIIGCAALALVGVICVMGLVAWSFLDCQSFAAFWRSLPILGGIAISC
jgi:pilus assembly protein CpaF